MRCVILLAALAVIACEGSGTSISKDIRSYEEFEGFFDALLTEVGDSQSVLTDGPGWRVLIPLPRGCRHTERQDHR